MKTADQIEISPSVAPLRNLNTQTAVAAPAPQRRQAADKNAIRPVQVKNVLEAELVQTIPQPKMSSRFFVSLCGEISLFFLNFRFL